ncbi:MAG TPA: patatin-like phospholipase family protein [Noviherbaspirillum sp.]|uniref:patatin-like phospholipase family protein n=1 Tax=Noviherbaspirillum sp. TaxID=1926288 RepID=UPI002D2E12ED|nr:patatin-like phospholipase family protein [Noviherbaspirillum sp.]HYD93811.1 patatin-like phospholipase family protein [Noviherbaspirillum sp.]
MAKKVVLLLQGGGALGAFQCGAWQALAPFIRESGYELTAVAGASIGALNAALIARHWQAPDSGTGMLREFWRARLATPPVSFFPLPGEYWRAWNGLLTGLLLGNRALFSPVYPHWHPAAGMLRFYMPLYRTDSAVRTMAELVGSYRETAPVLYVQLTDVESGRAVLESSAARPVTPHMLAASIAIPLLFSPVVIDGRACWDGEMRSNTLLPEVLAALRTGTPPGDEPDDLLVIVVDMFNPRTKSLPASTLQSHYRFLNILLGGKLEYDRRGVEATNEFIDTLARLRSAAEKEGDTPLAAAVRQEYRKMRAQRHVRVELMHVGRAPFRYEHISRDFDYSPQYIDRLIRQGFESASAAVREYRQEDLALPAASADTGSTLRARDPKRLYPRLVYDSERPGR